MDNNGGLSAGDALALQNTGMNGNSLMWLILIAVVIAIFAKTGNGAGNGPAMPFMMPLPQPSAGTGVTQPELTAGLNNQMVQTQLQQLALATNQNNYEVVQAVNGQTNTLQQQNYTNQINAIQGFNQVTNQLMGQTNQLSAQISNLSHHMDECCCDMKSMIKDNRIADLEEKLRDAKEKLSNAQQTQTLLATSGRWVSWAGTGTQTAGVVTAA